MKNKTCLVIRILSVSISVAVLLFSWLAVDFYTKYQTQSNFFSDDFRMLQLRNKIAYLDAAMTMSVRAALYADTTSWEERYNRLVEKFDQEIRESSQVLASRIKIDDLFNREAMAMERRAFYLIKTGKKDEAARILYSGQYRAEKKAHIEDLLGLINASDRILLIEEWRGRLVYYDEALSMSAVLAAFSGEKFWQDNYNQTKPLLADTMEKLSAMAGRGGVGDLLPEIKASYQGISRVEQQAFALVNQNKAAEARALLLGPSYAAAKLEYQAAMGKLAQRTEIVAKKTNAARYNQAVLYLLVIGLGLIILIINLLYTYRLVNSCQSELELRGVSR